MLLSVRFGRLAPRGKTIDMIHVSTPVHEDARESFKDAQQHLTGTGGASHTHARGS